MTTCTYYPIEAMHNLWKYTVSSLGNTYTTKNAFIEGTALLKLNEKPLYYGIFWQQDIYVKILIFSVRKL